MPTLLRDGKMEITRVTCRDMGGAFLVALLGTHVPVVAHFRRLKVPLVILAPIALTFVGIAISLLFRLALAS